MSRRRDPLDARRWFDPSLPQTLQIALWLLYIGGAFELLYFMDRTDAIGLLRLTGGLGTVGGMAVIASHIGGGFLLANGRRLGHRLALVAAFSPFLVRLWVEAELGLDLRLYDIITGRDMIGFMFEVALVALLLHPQSRRHVKIWLT